MKKSTKIFGLAGILLVGMTTASNEVPLNTKNLNRRIPIVAAPNLFKGIELVDIPKIELPEAKVQESLRPYGPKRLNEKTLNKFINFIYKNVKVSAVVDKKFVKSIVDAESERYVYVKSNVGARGLMQLMPDTWHIMEKESDFYKEAFNPYKNLRAGIKYLDHLNTYCKGTFPKWNKLSVKNKQIIIAAAYNGGIGRLMKNNWDINEMPEETRLYVKKIKKFNP
ncbi:lytic transglycosylase domain-containing protein [Candidatus Pacearchaeota archaeon]|nr:lytic transglycosylase domain-containing protein [Candidatus Pacearchaeota archaeon]